MNDQVWLRTGCSKIIALFVDSIKVIIDMSISFLDFYFLPHMINICSGFPATKIAMDIVFSRLGFFLPSKLLNQKISDK